MRRLAIVILAFIFAASAHAQTSGVYFSSNAWMASRSAAPGSSAPVVTMPYSKINVCNTTSSTPPQCTTAAIIYSDAALTQVIQQPITADGQGNFGFYIGTGQYKFNILAATGGIVASYPFTATSGGVTFTGGTLTQPLILAGAPTTGNGAATKAYVDANGGSVNGIKTATVAAASGLAANTSGSTVTVAPDSTHVIPVNSGSSTTYLNGAGGYSTPTGTGGATGPTLSLLANVAGVPTGSSAFGIQASTVGVLNANARGNGATTTSDGRGFFQSVQSLPVDNTISRNLNGAQGHVNDGDFVANDMKSPGIGQGRTTICNAYKREGDTSCMRTFCNFMPGGGTDSSREGHECEYNAATPMGDGMYTVSAGATTGSTLLALSPCSGSGENGLTNTDCSAGGAALIRNTPLYTAAVSHNVDPSPGSYGTLSVNHFLAVTPFTTIPSGVPDIASGTSVLTGSNVTVTVGAFTNGTPASSGFVAVSGSGGTNDLKTECLAYTLSGTSLTLLNHRYAHEGTVYAFFGECTYAEPPNITRYSSGRLVATVLGVVSSNSGAGTSVLAYSNYESGVRSAAWGGTTAFLPTDQGGDASQSAMNFYRGAGVLGGEGAATNSDTGPMPLEANNVNWTVGETLAQVGVPAQLYNFSLKVSNPGAPGSQNSNNFESAIILGNWHSVIRSTLLSNPVSSTNKYSTVCPTCITGGVTNGYVDPIRYLDFWNAPGGAGIYDNYLFLPTAPLQNLIQVAGCAAGDPDAGCANSPPFNVFNFNRPAGGATELAYTPAIGQFYWLNGPPVRYSSGVQIDNIADGTSGGVMTYSNFTLGGRFRGIDGSGTAHSVAWTDDIPAAGTKGMATLVAGTVTVTTSAACTPGSSCNYQLANCGKNASTVIGLPSIASATAGTSFIITSITAAAATATADVSNVCWRIN